MAWTGVPGDDGIYVARGVQWPPQLATGSPTVWGVPGVGTSHTPAICIDYRAQIRLAWKGVNGDSAIYSTSRVGGVWQPQERVGYFVPDQTDPTKAETFHEEFPATSMGPALVTRPGKRTLMFWKGAANDDSIWFSSLADEVAGPHWAQQWAIPDVGTSVGPSAALWKKPVPDPTVDALLPEVWVAWQGIPGDDGIYLTKN